MTWRKSYERWKQTEHLDPELKERLIELEGDEQALEDCFYKDLEFYIGGMRGEISLPDKSDEYLHCAQSIGRVCGIHLEAR